MRVKILVGRCLFWSVALIPVAVLLMTGLPADVLLILPAGPLTRSRLKTTRWEPTLSEALGTVEKKKRGGGGEGEVGSVAWGWVCGARLSED
jgi:hypothetical protein